MPDAYSRAHETMITGGNSSKKEWPDRYSRQVAFAPIGTGGQSRLESSSVLIVGCGALGASLAQHMARAGVGKVSIADRDYIEPSNLQRQVLFDESDARAALPKATAAADKLRRINSGIQIEAHVTHVANHNVGALIEGASLVLDGTDNAATRLLLSDACFRLGIPFAYGGVVGSKGMSALLRPGATACLRCLIGDEEAAGETESCDTAGVLSPAVEFVASLQAIEAMKWLSGNGQEARKTWLTADLWHFGVTEAILPGPSAGCLHCSPGRPRQREERYGRPCPVRDGDQAPPVVLCGRNSVQVTLETNLPMENVQTVLEACGCTVFRNRYLLKAQWPNGEGLVYFPDGRVLVQGTTNIDRALELCARIYPSSPAARQSLC